MAEPASRLERPDTSSRAPHPPTRLPYYQGILPLIASFILGQQFVSRMLALPDSIDDRFGAPHVTLLIAALATGAWGLFRLPRSLKAREFARNHPDEPWLWDHPWTLETVAPPVSRGALVMAALACVPCVALLGALGFLLVEAGSSPTEHPDRSIALALLLGLTGLTVYFGWRWALRPLRQRLETRRCFGQMRLRLPRIPLPLGGSATVELVAEHYVPEMSPLFVTLRRIRTETRSTGSGKSEKLVTKRETPFEHMQSVRLKAFTAENPVVMIPLDFPSKDPRESTWREPPVEMYWELEISVSAKKDSQFMKATFRLPVYFTGGPLDDRD